MIDEKLVSILLIFSTPIVAIVFAFIDRIKRNRNERDIRQLLIEHHTDMETVKLLLAQQKKPTGAFSYTSLRLSGVLLGGGLGAMISLDESIAIGAGLGLLLTFIIEFVMRRATERPQKQDHSEQ